jgi:hypothetical protein
MANEEYIKEATKLLNKRMKPKFKAACKNLEERFKND